MTEETKPPEGTPPVDGEPPEDETEKNWQRLTGTVTKAVDEAVAPIKEMVASFIGGNKPPEGKPDEKKETKADGAGRTERSGDSGSGATGAGGERKRKRFIDLL